MADGLNAGQFGVGMQGVGAVLGAIGAWASASAQKASLRAQADIADINAKIADGDAQATLAAGQREEQRSMLFTAGLKGTQRTRLAANGVDLGVGSAARVLTTTDVMGQIDANQIKANAVRQAWGHRIQATNHQNDALRSRANASAISPAMAATTSLIGSAGQVASNWYAMNKVGNGSGSSPGLTTGDFSRMDRNTPSGQALNSYWG